MPFTLTRGLYAITDCVHLDYPEMLDRTERILKAGVAAVQYRDKTADSETRRETAARLHELCRKHATPLIVNDDIDAALAAGAEGIHLGREDASLEEARRRAGGGVLIGISCYNDLERAVAAEAAGADYVAFGAMFPTSSKDTTVPATPDLIAQAKAVLSIPVAAIGGLTPENCREVVAAGADLLAVISSVYQTDDPAAVVGRFNEIIFGRESE
jgi:thiamine-phosphate pyrophosphorylase